MSDVMSFAELGEQYVELLPARTVLSLLPAGTGANGDAGTPGPSGQGTSKFTFFGIFGYGGSDSSYTFSATGSGAHGNHG
ncbi:MAG: hypothetical protein ACRDTA_07085 [Pseudonocardiaceae bacterium]